MCGRNAAFVARTFTLDLRSLAAFRVGLGLLLVADSLLRTRDFGLMFDAAGVFPPDLLRASLGDASNWSVALLADASWWQAAVLGTEGVAGILLAAGVWTRFACVLGWITLVSIIRRTLPATNAGDLWLACQLFWGMFLPLGAAWSFDARGGRAAGSTTVASVATAALVTQLCLVYLGAGLAKCNPAWFSGDALGHVLSVHDHGRPVGTMIAGIEWLARPLTWGVLGAELLLPPVILAMPSASVRGAVAAVLFVFHAAIAATMSIGLFAAVGMVAPLPLLPGRLWDRGGGRDADVGPPLGLSGPASSLCAAALALAVASFVQEAGPWRERPLPRPVQSALNATFLGQRWGMFGDVPPQEQWVYGRAELADGSVVDLLRHGRPCEPVRPAGGFASLAHHRWHKFFWILPRPDVRVFAGPAAEALARHWNERHPRERHVRALEIHFVRQGKDGPSDTLRDLHVASWPARSAAGRGNLERFLRGGELHD